MATYRAIAKKYAKLTLKENANYNFSEGIGEQMSDSLYNKYCEEISTANNIHNIIIMFEKDRKLGQYSEHENIKSIYYDVLEEEINKLEK